MAMPSGENPPHRDRHDQRGQRRDGQRDEGKKCPAAVARHIGRQRQQRTQFGAALGRRLHRLRLDAGRLGRRRISLRRQRRLAAPVFQPFHCAHEM